MRVIKYSEEAHDDIVRLNEYIAQVCKAPLTAKRYLMGLEQRIMWLQQNADLFHLLTESLHPVLHLLLSSVPHTDYRASQH